MIRAQYPAGAGNSSTASAGALSQPWDGCTVLASCPAEGPLRIAIISSSAHRTTLRIVRPLAVCSSLLPITTCRNAGFAWRALFCRQKRFERPFARTRVAPRLVANERDIGNGPVEPDRSGRGSALAAIGARRSRASGRARGAAAVGRDPRERGPVHLAVHGSLWLRAGAASEATGFESRGLRTRAGKSKPPNESGPERRNDCRSNRGRESTRLSVSSL